jgi:hypothetical protein
MSKPDYDDDVLAEVVDNVQTSELQLTADELAWLEG